MSRTSFPNPDSLSLPPAIQRSEGLGLSFKDDSDDESLAVRGSSAAARALNPEPKIAPATPDRKRTFSSSSFESSNKKQNMGSCSFASPARSSSSSLLPPTPQRGRRAQAHESRPEDLFSAHCQSLIQNKPCLVTPRGCFPVINRVNGKKDNFVDVYQLENSEDICKINPSLERSPIPRDMAGKLPPVLIKRISLERQLREPSKRLYDSFQAKISHHLQFQQLIKDLGLPIRLTDYLNAETALSDGFIMEFEVVGSPICSDKSTWIVDPEATFETLSAEEQVIFKELRTLFTYLPEFQEEGILLDAKQDNGKIIVLSSGERVVQWFDLCSDLYDREDFFANIGQALRSYFPDTPNAKLFSYLFSGLTDRLQDHDKGGESSFENEFCSLFWEGKIQQWENNLRRGQ